MTISACGACTCLNFVFCVCHCSVQKRCRVSTSSTYGSCSPGLSMGFPRGKRREWLGLSLQGIPTLLHCRGGFFITEFTGKCSSVHYHNLYYLFEIKNKRWFPDQSVYQWAGFCFQPYQRVTGLLLCSQQTTHLSVGTGILRSSEMQFMLSPLRARMEFDVY